jgi:DNA-directed RNA polymerase sigma subunit (sigma70/sigma32)
MPKKASPDRSKFTTKGGLIRETAYLHPDEEKALEDRAKKQRTSKSEIMRRALRLYLKIPD